MNPVRVVIAGATGLIGSHLLRIIKDDSSFSEINILTRRKIEGLNSPSIHQYITNLDDEKLLNSIVSGDVVVCTIGTTIKKAGSQERFREVDYSIPLKLAHAASKNNIPHYILVSAIGSDPHSKVFYNKIKGEVERDLVKIKFRSIHILHPSLLIGNRDEKRFGEDIGQKLFPLIDPFIPPKYRSVRAETVAKKIKEIAILDKTGIHHYEGKFLYPSF